jgi:hypothetical protein
MCNGALRKTLKNAKSCFSCSREYHDSLKSGWQPMFVTASLEGYAKEMAASANILTSRLADSAARHQVVDIWRMLVPALTPFLSPCVFDFRLPCPSLALPFPLLLCVIFACPAPALSSCRPFPRVRFSPALPLVCPPHLPLPLSHFRLPCDFSALLPFLSPSQSFTCPAPSLPPCPSPGESILMELQTCGS